MPSAPGEVLFAGCPPREQRTKVRGSMKVTFSQQFQARDFTLEEPMQGVRISSLLDFTPVLFKTNKQQTPQQFLCCDAWHTPDKYSALNYTSLL